MDRTQIALEITKTLLEQDTFSYESTSEIAYDAVELTDTLLELLSRPQGTVKVESYEDDQEKLAEEEAKRESAGAPPSVSAKGSWFK